MASIMDAFNDGRLMGLVQSYARFPTERKRSDIHDVFEEVIKRPLTDDEKSQLDAVLDRRQ